MCLRERGGLGIMGKERGVDLGVGGLVGVGRERWTQGCGVVVSGRGRRRVRGEKQM